MYQRILLAYDGSKSGQQALLECRDVAQWSQAAVSLVAVTPLYIHMVGVEAGIYDSELAAQEKEKYKGILSDGLQQLQSAGFHVSGEVLVGETVDEIVRYAKKINADLIKVLTGATLKQRLDDQGIDVQSSTPEELAAHVRAEIAKWVKVVKEANLGATE